MVEGRDRRMVLGYWYVNLLSDYHAVLDGWLPEGVLIAVLTQTEG